MSLKALKDGIKNRDWIEVINAFENMTGEDLGIDLDEETDDVKEVEIVPKGKRGRPKKAVIQPSESERVKRKNKIDVKGPLVNPNRPNLFESMLPQVINTKEDKEAREFDKKYAYNATKTERRETVKKIKVKCAVCGVTKRIYPSEFIKLTEGSRYRCNEC